MRRRVLRLAAGAIAAIAIVIVIAVLRPYPQDRLSPDGDAPLVVTDRDGEVLRQIPSASGRREAWVGLDEVPPLALQALLVAEDETFFDHHGVAVRGLERAAWLDAQRGRFAYGGSTITMQLARLLRPELARKSLVAKLDQIVDAWRLERALDKRQILEQYLNRAYYGHGAVGLEAAARTYFGKPARALGDGEASFLAVLPRAPSAYDPLASLEPALRRRVHVLDLLEKKGLLSAEERRRIEAEPLSPSAHPAPFLAPHFVELALQQLPADERTRGGVVRTTLDLTLQRRLERRVGDHVAELTSQHLSQAGVVVLDTARGEVLALVGSADFGGPRGQTDITRLRRHPGSALKPFVYAAAIEAGANPASIAADASDVPSDYHVDRADPRDRGPVRYREALAGSYNLAAVHVLEQVGIEPLLGRLREAGLGELPETPSLYGLRLALGSATVSLLDLAAAYGFVARGGNVISPRAVLEIAHRDDRWRPAPRRERRLFDAAISWLVMDMLADAEARHPRFGAELPLDLPFAVAAKTGTSRGFADTVAVGVTRELTVAAWAGNFDGKPTDGLVAMTSAAPLVRAGLLLAGRGRALTLPSPPAGVVAARVCALSGRPMGSHCPRAKLDHFLAGRAPTEPCDWHRADGVHLPAIYDRWAARRAPDRAVQ